MLQNLHKLLYCYITKEKYFATNLGFGGWEMCYEPLDMLKIDA